MNNTTETKEVTPGYKSSEFWLTVASSAVGLAVASGAFPMESPTGKLMGLLMMILANLGYSVSRGMAKK